MAAITSGREVHGPSRGWPVHACATDAQRGVFSRGLLTLVAWTQRVVPLKHVGPSTQDRC